MKSESEALVPDHSIVPIVSVVPTVLTIFGITGDLATRKLLPALFALHQKKLLPENFRIVGFSRRELNSDEFQEHVRGVLAKNNAADEATLASFVARCSYVAGFFDQKEGYAKLAETLGALDEKWQSCSNKMFYLAVPPVYYETMFTQLSDSGLTIPCGPDGGWTRVVVEKPFGNNFETAERLDQLLGKLFSEDQIYRIDHYLGKETVQNILAFRFSNSFLAPAWNGEAIDEVRIRLYETLGVETRGGFYDDVGALRDIGQNHLLQLVALFLMDQPESFSAEAVRAGRLSVLQNLQAFDAEAVAAQTIRGQYEGYTREKEVGAMSRTETYFKIKAFLKNKQWAGVPIILEGGKKMTEAKAEVEIVFKHRTPCLCPPESGKHYTNMLRYRIQPNERISLSFWVKRPGAEMVIEEKDFSFDYAQSYDKTLFVEAYEKLLLDAFHGNQTLFVSTKEILASWKFIDPIVKAWQAEAAPLHPYEPGAADITNLPFEE